MATTVEEWLEDHLLSIERESTTIVTLFNMLLYESLSAVTLHTQEPPAVVVGMGSCCIDYLAQVAAYPQPDDKLRTERLMVLAHSRGHGCVAQSGLRLVRAFR